MTKTGNKQWKHRGWKITSRNRGYGSQGHFWKYKASNASKSDGFDAVEIFSDTLDDIKESIWDYEDAYA